MSSLVFNKLPLQEAAIRLTLADLLPVNLTELASLFGRIQGRFQEMLQSPQHEPAPGRQAPLGWISFGPPRTESALFRSRDRGLALTIQPDLLVLRWLRLPDIEGGAAYPGYEELKSEVAASLTDLACVLGRVPAIEVVNMSYGNFISSAGYSAEATLRRYFVESACPAVISPKAVFHGVNYSWQDSGTDMRLVFERGTRQLDGRPDPGFGITTVAGFRFDPAPYSDDTLERVHGALQDLFENLISDTAKQEWGYAGRSTD